MTNETCKKCGQEIREGELITGQAWNGDGGEHITCPEPIIARHDDIEYMPVDERTGVYELYLSMVEAMITENRRREQDRMMLDGGL